LMDRVRTEGSTALHEELRRVDPRSAERIHPNDIKRIVRALEVYEGTGVAISERPDYGVETTTGKSAAGIG